MRLAEHGALQKSDDAVGVIIDEQNLDRQFILRQGGQFVLGVLEPAIAGHADHLARFPGLPDGAGRAHGGGKRVAERPRAQGIEKRSRLEHREKRGSPVIQDGLIIHQHVLAAHAGAQKLERRVTILGQPFQPFSFAGADGSHVTPGNARGRAGRGFFPERPGDGGDLAGDQGGGQAVAGRARVFDHLKMARGKLQAEATGIEFGKPRAEGEKQIAFAENILDRAQARDAAERKRMVGGDGSLARGGGEDRSAQLLRPTLHVSAGVASAGAQQQHRLAAGGNLPRRRHDFIRQGPGRGRRRGGRTSAGRGQQEIMRKLDEGRSGQGSTERLSGFSEGFGDFVRAGDAAGKTRERADDLKLLRSLMQSSAGRAQKRRSDVGADQKDGRAALKGLQQRDQGKEIAGAGGGEDGGDAAAAAVKTIGGKSGRLFMAHHPVSESGRLPERFIERDVMDAGNAKAGGDPVAQQGRDYGLRARHVAGLGRCM